MKRAEYISFEDGRCRRLRATTEAARVEEAIQACAATQCAATLVDAQMNVVARVQRVRAALDGFIVVKEAQQ